MVSQDKKNNGGTTEEQSSNQNHISLKLEPNRLVITRFVLFAVIIYVVATFFPSMFPAAVCDQTDPLARLECLFGQLTKVLLPIVAIGLVTSAFVEAFKTFVRPRAFYHKIQLKRWLRGVYTGSPGTDPATEYQFLMDLCAAGDEWALLRSQSEDLINELTAGLGIAVDNSRDKRYHPLIERVACMSSKSDLDDLLGRTQQKPDDAKMREVRRRVNALIQRRLEGLAIRMRVSWAAYLHSLSFLVSATIVYWAYKNVYSGRTLFAIALVGAAVAPLARDLVAAVSSARQKSE